MDERGTRPEPAGSAGLENEAEFDASVVAGGDASTLLTPEDSVRVDAEPPLQAAASPGAAPQPAWAGKVLGHFRLLRPLGAGAMGMVVQAQDVHLGRIVALKVLRKRIRGMREEDRVRQFLREARAAASIDHPNVVPVYEINHHEGWWYIAMEMLEGGNLQTVVRAAGPLPPERACPIIADAATALAAAHQAGIIHRDIKPGNLMLTRTGRCKVTDFGLVHFDDPNDPFDLTNQSVGTPYYMAPEVIRHQPQTPAIDIYGLGATLYYALTGEPPFTGPDHKAVMRRHLDDPPPDPRAKVAECPPSLALLVQRSLAKKPEDRPSAAEFALALRAESIGAAPAEGHPLAQGSGTWVGLSGFGQPGSTLGRSGLGPRPAGAAHGPDSRAASPSWAARAAIGVLIALTAGILLGVAFLIGRMGLSVTPPEPPPDVAAGADPRAAVLLSRLAGRFPQTPPSYGVRGANAVPLEDGASRPPPPFSWIGKVDVQGIHFVASRTGRYYWPVDAPAAALITAESFVGYPSAQAAEQAGKRPAPSSIR